MSILFIILSIVAGIIILVLVIALFVKSDYAVSRSIVINQPKQAVFDYIKYLKNQDYYSKWVMMDPDMKKEYWGTDATPGFKSAWESDDKKVGKGEQEIVKIAEGESFDTKIHFIKPFEGLADASMTTESLAPNQTKVGWGFVSKMKYPMNFMLLFMNMDKMIGNDLEIGLTNLKAVLEKNKLYNMKIINPYLNFEGNTEEAFNFYKSVLGGEFAVIQRFKDTPEASRAGEYGDKLMHIALALPNGNVLMGTDAIADLGHTVTPGNSINLSIGTDSKEEADKIFNGLAEGGKITVPIANMFWGSYFGMVTDRFGTHWMVSYEG